MSCALRVGKEHLQLASLECINCCFAVCVVHVAVISSERNLPSLSLSYQFVALMLPLEEHHAMCTGFDQINDQLRTTGVDQRIVVT